MAKTIIKWTVLPLLMLASPLTRFAARYEQVLDIVICLAAIVVVQLALGARNYYWAAGFAAIAIVFSPLSLLTKLFLLTGFLTVATFVPLSAAWKTMLAVNIRKWRPW